MKRKYFRLLAAFIFMLVFITCERPYQFQDGKIVGINTIEELDNAAVFSFAIISDNKGDGQEKEEFSNMVKWIHESNDSFVIGLGDHVKKGWGNDFLKFLKENEWWQNNFYPNIADGENEYYGKSQGDWGAGAPFLDTAGLPKKDNVTIRSNGCEYYARIKVSGYTIHLIQLHYSDTPEDDTIAFNKNSRQYLIETLDTIEKGPTDIIIAAAHSRIGSWVQLLSKEQQKLVMKKCDIVLSATTHFFERIVYPEYSDEGALCINTGSITYPSKYCPFGYIQVHVLKKPLSLVIQYYNAKKTKREFQHPEYAFIKIINGKTLKTHFRDPVPEENMDVVVGTSDKDYSHDELLQVVSELYILAAGADNSYLVISSGIKKGNVTMKNLWDIFLFNNELWCLTLTAEQAVAVFGKDFPLKGKDIIRLAINAYYGSYLAQQLQLPGEAIKKTGKYEMDIFTEWLKTKNQSD